MPGLQRLASRKRPDDRGADSNVKVKIGIFIPDSSPGRGWRRLGYCRQCTYLWIPVNFSLDLNKRRRSFNFFVDKIIVYMYSVDGLLNI